MSAEKYVSHALHNVKLKLSLVAKQLQKKTSFHSSQFRLPSWTQLLSRTGTATAQLLPRPHWHSPMDCWTWSLRHHDSRFYAFPLSHQPLTCTWERLTHLCLPETISQFAHDLWSQYHHSTLTTSMSAFVHNTTLAQSTLSHPTLLNQTANLSPQPVLLMPITQRNRSWFLNHLCLCT